MEKLWIVLFLAAVVCETSTVAVAQFPDVGGHIGPSNGEIAEILVGAGAAVVVVVYVLIPKQKTVEGCVQSNEGRLQLTNDKTKQLYELASGNVTLQPGRRVRVKGKSGKKEVRDARV